MRCTSAELDVIVFQERDCALARPHTRLAGGLEQLGDVRPAAHGRQEVSPLAILTRCQHLCILLAQSAQSWQRTPIQGTRKHT